MCIKIGLNKPILHCITDMASNKTYNGIDLIEKCIFIEMKKGEFRGFKQDFLIASLNEVEKEFYVCTKCNGLMRNACQIGEEQMLVCELCLTQGDKHQPMAKSRKKIPELRTNCPLQGRGCEWNGTIAEIETHLNMCSEFIIECIYKCDVIMKRSELTKHCMNECENREVNCQHCKAKMQYKYLQNHYSTCIDFPLKCPNECLKNLTRKEVELHVQNECPNTILNCTNECGIELKRCEIQNHCEKECQYRKINCKHCTVIIAFKEIENHNRTCPEFPLLCPNECLKDLTRKELGEHIGNECPNTTVECPYKEIGCKETIKRRDVEEHEKRYESKHLGMTIQYFSTKTDQNEKKCKSQIDQIEKNCKSQIDQIEKNYKSQIDQIEKNCKSQIDQIEKNCKSQIDQIEKNCKSHGWTNEPNFERLNTPENENLTEKRLMEMENKVKELTEEISYPVVLRDELRNEILVKYLHCHINDNDPLLQFTKNEMSFSNNFLLYPIYQTHPKTKITYPVRSLYEEHFKKKPLFDRLFENTLSISLPRDDREVKVEKVMVIYKNSFRYNQDQFYIQFEYEKAQQLIRTIILGQKYFGKGIAGTKFKLRILDRKNIHESPAFESIESTFSAGVYLIAEIPKDLILEERFRNENKSVSFIIQKQEMDSFPWWYMDNTQVK